VLLYLVSRIQSRVDGEEFSGYFVGVGAEKLKREGRMTNRDGIQNCGYLLKFELRDAFGFFWFLI